MIPFKLWLESEEIKDPSLLSSNELNRLIDQALDDGDFDQAKYLAGFITRRYSQKKEAPKETKPTKWKLERELEKAMEIKDYKKVHELSGKIVQLFPLV